jgi:hypothetical protein
MLFSLTSSDGWTNTYLRSLLWAHALSGCFGIMFLVSMTALSIHAMETCSCPWFDLPAYGVVDRRGRSKQKITAICESDPVAGDCGNWTSFEGSCYQVSEPGYPFWVGQDYCKSVGGHLVVITSRAENDFAHDVCVSRSDGPCYIGLFKDTAGAAENENWQWVDGTPVVYTEWSYGEPNNARGRENVAGYLPGHFSPRLGMLLGWIILFLDLLVVSVGWNCLWCGTRDGSDMMLSCMGGADCCCSASLFAVLGIFILLRVRFSGWWALMHVMLGLQALLFLIIAWFSRRLRHGLEEGAVRPMDVVGQPIGAHGIPYNAQQTSLS